MILSEARAATEPAHRAAIEALPEQIRHIAGYHAGWWDADRRPARHLGKAIRPALTLGCAWAAAGGLYRDPPQAVPQAAVVGAAAAVDMVHDFSLLHDDVMDGDRTRRYRPTAWAVFGVGPAILVGAAVLVTLALDTLADYRAGPVKTPAGAVQELCAGQPLNLAFEDRERVRLAECVQMSEGKTGALLGVACELGAPASGADTTTATRCRDFGRRLGLAFQLADDLLGIWGDPDLTGRPAGADLSARKKSLPVVAALTSGTDAGRHLAWIYNRDEALDGDGIAHWADLIEAADGRSSAQAEATRQLEAPFDGLTAATPAAGLVDLHLLADLVTRRDR